MSTFQDALAQSSDAQLRALIATRPDAFFPTPPSTASLATRLSLPGSAALALRSLNAADLRALELLADAGAELEAVNRASASIGSAELTHLRERALVYGPDEALRIAPGALSGLPPGWRVSDPHPEDIAPRVDALPARERRVLETLASSGGIGTTRAAAPDADPTTPVARLIAAELLVRVDASTVRLPRPVREVLAGGTPRVFPVEEPALADANQPAVDEAAAGQGLETVRQMRQLLTRLLAQPVALNKDGTVGVRALSALQKELAFDPALLITIGEAGGLIGRGVAEIDGTETDALAATRDALTWIDAPLAEQWATVLAAWAASPWRVDTGHKLLSAEMHAPDIRHARQVILAHGGDMRRLLFHAPIAASGMRDALIGAVVSEAHTVGALASPGGSPAASSPLLALLDGTDITAATKALVPAEVDYLIAQADMTILAPGPLAPEAARFLERIAELESPGLASVWRVTEASLRKALETGLTSADIHAWLGRHVLGEVPQGLSYLIDDVSRTHGSIRAGSALSYIRSDDPALIAAAAERVAVRVLAPTVAVSAEPLPRLVAQLRDAGFQPTAENSDGVELNIAPEPSLVPATPSPLPRPRSIEPEQAERIIAVLRSGPAASAAGVEPSDTLETLRAAARGRRHVTLGYVDKNGRGKTATVLPLSVSAGQVDALDEATDRVVRIALPRITRVVLS
ncbi:helicase-associated domain-containing protein [Corynebacterium sp. TA-R-1]|uniref:Helicase-associated domain-containing protein n=1 Tax=Corynebacterium stercoris TaxID=2943490 RepID=A0ABT1G307_9CORY|nr:helicase-associated domain-containing protein [Corynebacterium stercoris]MCP1388386.1 helicase-associated domain-containing protein [Corynebacterium stercoris]